MVVQTTAKEITAKEARTTLGHDAKAYSSWNGRFDATRCRGITGQGQCHNYASFSEPGWWTEPTGEKDGHGSNVERYLTDTVGWCGRHAPSKVKERDAKKVQKRAAESAVRNRTWKIEEAKSKANGALREIGWALAFTDPNDAAMIDALVQGAHTILEERDAALVALDANDYERQG